MNQKDIQVGSEYAVSPHHDYKSRPTLVERVKVVGCPYLTDDGRTVVPVQPRKASSRRFHFAVRHLETRYVREPWAAWEARTQEATDA